LCKVSGNGTLTIVLLADLQKKTAVRERLSLSIPLKPENGPDEKIDDDPSDSNVVDDGPIFRLLGVG